jgi:hypothetical protein
VLPGAGLEPARTLPNPRGFKYVACYRQQTLTGRKALYGREFNLPYGALVFLGVAWSNYTVTYN